MEYILSDNTVGYFAQYDRNVWNIREEDDMAAAKQAIACTASFLRESLGLPSNLRSVGIEDERHFEAVAEKAARSTKTTFVQLSKEDIMENYRRTF